METKDTSHDASPATANVSGMVVSAPVEVNTAPDTLEGQCAVLGSKSTLAEITFNRSNFVDLPQAFPLVGETQYRFPVPRGGISVSLLEPIFLKSVTLQLESTGRVPELTFVALDGSEHKISPVRDGVMALSAKAGFFITEITVGESDGWRKKSPDFLKFITLRGYDLDPKTFSSVEEKIGDWLDEVSDFDERADKAIGAIETEGANHRAKLEIDGTSRTKIIKEHPAKLSSITAHISFNADVLNTHDEIPLLSDQSDDH